MISEELKKKYIDWFNNGFMDKVKAEWISYFVMDNEYLIADEITNLSEMQLEVIEKPVKFYLNEVKQDDLPPGVM